MQTPSRAKVRNVAKPHDEPHDDRQCCILVIGAAVVVVLNGMLIASAPAAVLVAGHVMVPLRSVVTAFAEDVSVGDGGSVRFSAGTHHCRLRIGQRTMRCDGVDRPIAEAPYAQEGAVYVPIGEVARVAGGTLQFDRRSMSLAVHVTPRAVVRTPAPLDPRAPQVQPTQVFTPEPPRATPTARAIEGGSPRPRRTAIPETPSRAPGG